MSTSVYLCVFLANAANSRMTVEVQGVINPLNTCTQSLADQ